MLAISYRREDSGPITGRICDRLQTAFGRDKVFMDIDSIPIGVDFRAHISHTLERCEALLVVIGGRWLGPKADGSNRIEEETDFVRLEVATALGRDILVIPLLVDQTHMPSAKLLPDDLKGIAFRNAMRIDSGIDFNHHMDRLCRSLQERRPTAPAKAKEPPQPKKIEKRESLPPEKSAPPGGSFRRKLMRLLLFLSNVLLSLLAIIGGCVAGGLMMQSTKADETSCSIAAATAGLVMLVLVFLLWKKWLWRRWFPKPVD